MAEIYFNAKGGTHYMRIRADVENDKDDVTVYEALIDGTDYVWFEGHPQLEIWELIELAIQSYLDYRVNDEVVRVKWRD